MPFPYTFPIRWENFPVASGRIRSIYRHCGPGVFEMWFGFGSNVRTPMGGIDGRVPSFNPAEPIPKWAEEIGDILVSHKEWQKEQDDRLTSIEYSMTDRVYENYFQVKTFYWRVIDKDTALTTGDGKDTEPIPSEFEGMILIDADAFVDTASTSGLPKFQIHNLTDGVDMLSVEITVDENEKGSNTATTQPVIDTTKDDVVTGDILRADVDVAGTDTKGLVLILRFRRP